VSTLHRHELETEANFNSMYPDQGPVLASDRRRLRVESGQKQKQKSKHSTWRFQDTKSSDGRTTRGS
jgi:hypothetical protein